MAALEPFFQSTFLKNLTREEIYLLEVDVFLKLYKELINFFRLCFFDSQNQENSNIDMETNMIENNFIRYLIRDILVTEEYTLKGIALYAQTSLDVIYDIIVGRNDSPSLMISRRIMELHRSTRPMLYREILAKIFPQ